MTDHFAMRLAIVALVVIWLLYMAGVVAYIGITSRMDKLIQAIKDKNEKRP